MGRSSLTSLATSMPVASLLGALAAARGSFGLIVPHRLSLTFFLSPNSMLPKALASTTVGKCG